MGKFLNPRLAVAPAPQAPSQVGVLPALTMGPVPAARTTRPEAAAERTSFVHTIGCWAVAACILAAQANDWMLRLVGEKAYLYWVALPTALAAFLFCGNWLRGLRTRTGKMWLLFGVWLFLSIPSS